MTFRKLTDQDKVKLEEFKQKHGSTNLSSYRALLMRGTDPTQALDIINKRNNLVSREELTDTEFDESELRKVDVGITRLRQKIEKVPKKPQFIKTIRSKGYMLVCREL